jgi:hypothetical protein
MKKFEFYIIRQRKSVLLLPDQHLATKYSGLKEELQNHRKLRRRRKSD